jgi:hypothetical protein
MDLLTPLAGCPGPDDPIVEPAPIAPGPGDDTDPWALVLVPVVPPPALPPPAPATPPPADPPPPPPPADPVEAVVRAGGARGDADRRIRFDLAGGTTLIVQSYAPPGKPMFKNWIVQCRRPGHGSDCGKSKRITPRFCRFHGRVEPIAFLMAWLEMDVPPGKTHSQRGVEPTAAQVAAWVAANGADFCRANGIDLDIHGAPA